MAPVAASRAAVAGAPVGEGTRGAPLCTPVSGTADRRMQGRSCAGAPGGGQVVWRRGGCMGEGCTGLLLMARASGAPPTPAPVRPGGEMGMGRAPGGPTLIAGEAMGEEAALRAAMPSLAATRELLAVEEAAGREASSLQCSAPAMQMSGEVRGCPCVAATQHTATSHARHEEEGCTAILWLSADGATRQLLVCKNRYTASTGTAARLLSGTA